MNADYIYDLRFTIYERRSNLCERLSNQLLPVYAQCERSSWELSSELSLEARSAGNLSCCRLKPALLKRLGLVNRTSKIVNPDV
jgi:hypothetical protein